MRWYVYVYYDEDHHPYYVGKGCARRAYRRHEVPVPPRERMVFRYFDEEEQAFQLEKDLIAFWGRRNYETNGLLQNKAIGGSIGPAGFKHPPEAIKKLSEWNKGRVKSPETRKKIADSKRGKKRPPHVGVAVSKATKGRWVGAKSPNAKSYVVTHPDGSEEVIDCMSAFCRKHDLSNAHMSSTASGNRKHHKGYKARHV